MALGPLLIGLFGVVNWALARRTHDDAHDASDPTQALASLAEQNATRSALDEAFSETSADAGSAYGTTEQLDALQRYAQGAPAAAAASSSTTVPVQASDPTPASPGNSLAIASQSSSSAPVTPSVPSTWVRVEPSPVDATSTAAPDDTATDRASAETAARELHAYIMRTSSANRDRTRIRTLQAAIGVTPDGLIGRETAARIKALTGLRIPGLS